MVRKPASIIFVLAVIVCGLVWSTGIGPWGETRTAWAGSKAETGKSLKAEAVKFPKAVFLEPTHHFAPIMEGATITHDFYVENKGDAPLLIQKVQPD